MSLPRKSLAIVSVVAAGSFALFGGAGPASASHSGLPTSLLTATDPGHTKINVVGTTALDPTGWCDDLACHDMEVNDAQWSVDGSRAVFIDTLDRKSIATVRHNDPSDVFWVQDGADSIDQRTSPSYQGTGSTIVWSESSDGSNAYIAQGSTSYGFEYLRVSPDDGADYTNPDGGPDARVAAQRTDVSGSKIVIWNGNSGRNAADWTPIADGTDPAISPDGTTVAYIDNNAIWTVAITGGTPAKVIDATATNPTWSPDGTKIAYNVGTNVFTTPSAGGGAGTQVSGLVGKPAYRSENKNLSARLAGPSRYETATATSGAYWKTKGDASDLRHPAKAVVLSRSDTFADALGGSALAAAKEGPLLMTPPTSLDPSTAAEIDRILDPGDPVYILGSTGAISASVEAALDAKGYSTPRLSGADRFETAVAIADAINTNPDYILVATGLNFPDALGAGAAAGSYDVPGASQFSAVVVLTQDNVLPAATKKYLDDHSGRIFGIGKQGFTATGSLYPDRVVDVYGDDRYQTAYAVAASFFAGSQQAGIATGNNWPDALAGGALMGTLNGPLLLTPGLSANVALPTMMYLSEESASLNVTIVFGSAGVVTDAQLSSVGGRISGPAGFTTATSVRFTTSSAGLRTTLSAGTTTLGTPEQTKAAPQLLDGLHR